MQRFTHHIIRSTRLLLALLVSSLLVVGCDDEGPAPGTPLSSVEVCFGDASSYNCTGKTVLSAYYVKNGQPTQTEFTPGRCYVMSADFYTGKEVGDNLTVRWVWLYSDSSYSGVQSYTFPTSDSAVTVTVPCTTP